jgi:hypothetical protein
MNEICEILKYIVIMFGIIALLFIYIYKEFPVQEDIASIEASIAKTISSQGIELIKYVKLENKLIAMYKLDQQIGRAVFTQGINGQYKIASAGYGSSPIPFFIEDTNQGKYAVIMGQNHNNEISYI